ncbi:hypothetical protein N1851_012820 [Merluccius polli]|uniref:Uncharacterized protein n=1 Tax=Merluccius polli TaxID=89951 RepID=A0AA47P231_MERPO|nr:hypothetical protein N1851_012820 [Merluccius polli]
MATDKLGLLHERHHRSEPAAHRFCSASLELRKKVYSPMENDPFTCFIQSHRYKTMLISRPKTKGGHSGEITTPLDR